MADVDDAIVAGVEALVLVVGCCVEGIAGWRYSVLVHRVTAFLWAGSRGVRAPAGPFTLYPKFILVGTFCLYFYGTFW